MTQSILGRSILDVEIIIIHIMELQKMLALQQSIMDTIAMFGIGMRIIIEYTEEAEQILVLFGN